MEQLNTMESFVEEGFKIKRDGKVITLTSDEMDRFRYLDIAVDGKNSLNVLKITSIMMMLSFRK